MDVELTDSGEQTAVRPDSRTWPGSRTLRRSAGWLRRHPMLLWAAGLLVPAAVLFWCYLRQAQTVGIGSDGASQAVQAWQMWHGNPLLRGWWLGDVSFYTVELPLNVIVQMVNGLRPGEMHILAAILYTVLVLSGAMLARGKARGREGVLRALLAAGIMLAPSVGSGTQVLLGPPDHTGTAVPILLTLLVLDRARERWWVPVVVCAMLTWAQVSDSLATFAAAAAVIVACGVRACSEIARRERPRKDRWYDASLVLAALASIVLAHVVLSEIHRVGGFYVPPVTNGFALISAMPGQSWALIYCVLILFGADFIGRQMGAGAVLALLHLIGVVLGFWALWIGVRGFFGRMDRVTQALVAGTVIILAAGLFGPHMAPVTGAHEIVTVLPFCAVLAGRLLGGRLAQARLEPVLAVGLACYLGGLAYNDSQPIAPSQHADLANWLVDHHLTSGLAGYWEANVTTLNSGGRVTLAPISWGGAAAYEWESDSTWYNPAVSYANFVVTSSSPQDVPYARPNVVLARFGPPVRTYHFREYTIMVWNYNVLSLLRVPIEGGF